MNVFLVPYTWHRHLAMAWWCAGAGLIAWWLVLLLTTATGMLWPPEWDAVVLLAPMATAIAGASILAEQNLRRRSLWARSWRTALAMLLTALLSTGWILAASEFLARIVAVDADADAADPTLVSLRYRLPLLLGASIASTLGPLVLRKGEAWASHLLAGPVAGLGAAALWHVASTVLGRDVYLAGAFLGLGWGGLHGLCCWPLPEELYAGWIRVLRGSRAGHRIPVDAPDARPKERFIGHFPRGLDLFLPAEEQATELHLSVAVDAKHRYRARGLAQARTIVRRWFERVNLHYDPQRPAPLETRLSSGDRLELGEGPNHAELEFVMLPKEES